MKKGRMTGYQAMEYILASAWSGGQVGGTSPEEIARVMFLPFSAPLDVMNRISAAFQKGGEVISGRERPKWGPKTTVESHPVKVGKAAHMGEEMVRDYTAGAGIRRPRPGDRMASVGAGGSYRAPAHTARERIALRAMTRGGEIYSRTGEGQTTSRHTPVLTSIF